MFRFVLQQTGQPTNSAVWRENGPFEIHKPLFPTYRLQRKQTGKKGLPSGSNQPVFQFAVKSQSQNKNLQPSPSKQMIVQVVRLNADPLQKKGFSLKGRRVGPVFIIESQQDLGHLKLKLSKKEQSSNEQQLSLIQKPTLQIIPKIDQVWQEEPCVEQTCARTLLVQQQPCQAVQAQPHPTQQQPKLDCKSNPHDLFFPKPSSTKNPFLDSMNNDFRINSTQLLKYLIENEGHPSSAGQQFAQSENLSESGRFGSLFSAQTFDQPKQTRMQRRPLIKRLAKDRIN